MSPNCHQICKTRIPCQPATAASLGEGTAHHIGMPLWNDISDHRSKSVRPWGIAALPCCRRSVTKMSPNLVTHLNNYSEWIWDESSRISLIVCVCAPPSPALRRIKTRGPPPPAPTSPHLALFRRTSPNQRDATPCQEKEDEGKASQTKY